MLAWCKGFNQGALIDDDLIAAGDLQEMKKLLMLLIQARDENITKHSRFLKRSVDVAATELVMTEYNAGYSVLAHKLYQVPARGEMEALSPLTASTGSIMTQKILSLACRLASHRRGSKENVKIMATSIVHCLLAFSAQQDRNTTEVSAMINAGSNDHVAIVAVSEHDHDFVQRNYLWLRCKCDELAFNKVINGHKVKEDKKQPTVISKFEVKEVTEMMKYLDSEYNNLHWQVFVKDYLFTVGDKTEE